MELPIYPISTNMGFSVGFAVGNVVGHPPLANVKGSHLKFLEKQLPEGDDFETLKPTFTDPENLELIKYYNLGEIHDNRSHYDY